ncbi:MAG: hypothetical protein OEU54_03985 [Gemmatimonadota bacterium]|nr:hypothetical protein [Gemmatimonadota bacterium]
MKTLSLVFGITATAVVASACSPHIVYDTSMQPVRDPLVTANVENGWMVVDSTDAGIRAVLELEMEAPAATAEFVTLHVPRLHCTISGEHLPAKVMREAPRCPTAPAQALRCPTDFTPEECDRYREEETPYCTYTVRAEFFFAQMPHLDENTHYFTFAQSDTPVQWVKAKSDR